MLSDIKTIYFRNIKQIYIRCNIFNRDSSFSYNTILKYCKNMSFSNTLYFSLTVIEIAVISVGIIGNILSFIVFSRKKFQKNSISTYCRALAVFECLGIIQLIHDVYRFIDEKTFFYDLSDFNCKIFFYLWMEYMSIPGWILVAFSIDKMLNMRVSKLNILKSKLFQWSVVAGIVLFCIFSYFALLISLKLEPKMGVFLCNLSFLNYYEGFAYVQMTMSCAIPFTIMIMTSIVTIRLFWKSRSFLERNGNSFKKRRITKYAISSIVCNLFFVFFKMSLMMYPLLPSTDFLYISIFLFIINCSSTFFIHLVTNSIFRCELLVIFRFKKPSANRI